MSGDRKSQPHPGHSQDEGASAGSKRPFAAIEQERTEQRLLCDNLELIADQLPENLDPTLCEHTYQALRVDLPFYHRNEEALYGLIGRQPDAGADVIAMINQIRQEHAIHTCYADEFREVLTLLRNGAEARRPDMFGYMLRCCFDSMRRHLDWEDLTVLPIARGRLSRNELDELSKRLEQNRRYSELSKL